ncbi:MAG: L,D-transpeptidase, partial [Alphaproteobacteria bacterium]
FSRPTRTFSSGCVRVEKAYDLARWLLGEKWDANNGDGILKTNRELQVKLNQKIPVYLEYRPVTVSATGIANYHADPYLRVPSYRR